MLTPAQIKECEQQTIKNESIPSINLMERAAEACTEWLAKNLYQVKKFNIFCGNGNNGGDGFAIARILKAKGFYVKVFSYNTKELPPEAAKNYKRLRELGDIELLSFDKAYDAQYEENSCVIDALFGLGLNKKIDKSMAKLVNFLNGLENVHKVSIDIPSGLYPNDMYAEDTAIFKADHTLTFQFWKRAFLHPETGVYAGKVHLMDINLDKKYIDDAKVNFFVNDLEIVSDFFKKREDFTHKGRFGKSAIIAGSYGKMGAAVLSVSAALRTGSGLVYSVSADSGYHIMQNSNPEAMFIKGGQDFITEIKPLSEEFTIGIGPGLGTEEETKKAFIDFLKNYSKPLVLDADALNIIAENKELLNDIPKNSIITPHLGEFQRLFGASENSFDRMELARDIAERHRIYIVLKDHRTQIITPERKVYYNITGNSGMAKGGSGDVLTGIITSLLAQGYTSIQACLLGVWLHGKAGDFATEKHSKEAVLPSDLVAEMGEVFKILNNEVAKL